MLNLILFGGMAFLAAVTLVVITWINRNKPTVPRPDTVPPAVPVPRPSTPAADEPPPQDKAVADSQRAFLELQHVRRLLRERGATDAECDELVNPILVRLLKTPPSTADLAASVITALASTPN